MIRHKCEEDLLFFTRYFFYQRFGSKFIVGPHHRLLADTLMKVYRGETSRLIINIPPGYTKTEMVVISFIAWCLAKYPRSKFIHTSYSFELALANSSAVREIVQSEEFQFLWPNSMRSDTKAKKRWFLEAGGGIHADSSGGSITGFRAGLMDPDRFTGAFVIDDPLKPDAAYSDVERNKINNRATNTFKSRLALESVPIVVIMQRLHEDDLTGFLLTGGTGDEWDHLILPAEIEDETEYPDEYSHGNPVYYDLPTGPLWPFKHTQKELDLLKVDRYTYASQYEQRPAPLGEGLFRTEWWKYYDKYDAAYNQLHVDEDTVVKLTSKIITADTAQKIKDHNDFSVFQCWGYGEDGNIYLLDQMRGKWEAPDLRANFMQFCDSHDFLHMHRILGVRNRYVEDKVSGTGLIQDINREKGHGWVQGIPRDIDKVSRAMGTLSHLAQGRVYLPSGAWWLTEYIREFEKFTPNMSHKHDDQIDPTLDAINILLISGSHISYNMIL